MDVFGYLISFMWPMPNYMMKVALQMYAIPNWMMKLLAETDLVRWSTGGFMFNYVMMVCTQFSLCAFRMSSKLKVFDHLVVNSASSIETFLFVVPYSVILPVFCVFIFHRFSLAFF